MVTEVRPSTGSVTPTPPSLPAPCVMAPPCLSSNDGVLGPMAAAAAAASRGRKVSLSEIEFKHMRFLITETPTPSTMENYIEEMTEKRVHDVIRVCDATYPVDDFQKNGIQVRDWPIADGQVPPPEMLEYWFNLLKTRFKESPDGCIAVHCVAGLGRSPVLVAVALMELGMKNEDAVELIRKKRRGAINQEQLNFLTSYRAKARLVGSTVDSSQKNKGCAIM